MTAREARPGVTVVHFHGGGYCVGSARIVRAWAARLSGHARCRVVLPEYRLAPEHPHPGRARRRPRGAGRAAGAPRPGAPGRARAVGRGVRRLGGRRPGPGPAAGPPPRRPAAPGRRHAAVAVAGPDRGPPGRARAGPPRHRAQPGLAGGLRRRLRGPDGPGRPGGLAAAGRGRRPAAAADPERVRRPARPRRRTAGRQRLGRRGGRHLHPVARPGPRLRAPARPARRRRQRPGPGGLVRGRGTRRRNGGLG